MAYGIWHVAYGIFHMAYGIWLGAKRSLRLQHANRSLFSFLKCFVIARNQEQEYLIFRNWEKLLSNISNTHSLLDLPLCFCNQWNRRVNSFPLIVLFWMPPVEKMVCLKCLTRPNLFLILIF